MDLQSQQIKVQDIMSANPLRVLEDAPMEDIFRMFSDNRLTCLPVVDSDDKIQGCILLADLERSRQLFDLKEYINIIMSGLDDDVRGKIAGTFAMDGPIDLKAREVMSVNILTTQTQESISDLSRRMFERNSHHAVVVDSEERVQGIVSSFDFVKLFTPSATHS
jgi:CBS domain-containing protein